MATVPHESRLARSLHPSTRPLLHSACEDKGQFCSLATAHTGHVCSHFSVKKPTGSAAGWGSGIRLLG
ncbi:hypothetical protein I79_001336 [Cricetulus griseus]|uniref:Uncharacterized protein n=1 Tax=Cricetulus griseus TaxID=10029 RepID=G3GUH4_CRIGR|nr:hypothetical protein I79_001336 [Cricetulus griseus]